MISEIKSGDLLLSKKKPSNILLYFLVFIAAAVVVFYYFFAFVPTIGESMENTIHDGQKCFVLRKCFTVERGDIVTINTSETSEEHIIIKRVIGLGGDKIIFMASQDNKYVDLYLCKSGEKYFVKQTEPYIKERMLNNLSIYCDIKILPNNPRLETTDITDDSIDENKYFNEFTVTVSKNCLFFLGDNRNISRDARYYGERNINKVTSKVLKILNS